MQTRREVTREATIREIKQTALARMRARARDGVVVSAAAEAAELVYAQEAARTLQWLDRLAASTAALAHMVGFDDPATAAVRAASTRAIREASALVSRLLLERDVLRFAFGAPTMIPADPPSQPR